MSANSLNEHLGYWQDAAKLDAYTAALAEVIKPGDRVLDLGAGTGLLGMLAARAGAGKVWSVDSGDILGVARDVAKANGLADRIEFVPGMSNEIDLPEVDVIVCDQIGGLAFDAGVLEFFADAKARALREGGVLVPAAFELFLAPVEAPGPYGQVAGWDGTDAAFDLDVVRTLAANTEFRTDPTGVELLADGQPIGSFASSCIEPIKANCEWTATRSGTVHGLSGWFNATMSPSVTMTNNPTDPNRMKRWINFYPVVEPIEVEAGDTVTGTIDIRPAGYLVTWSVAAHGRQPQRMSTFAGRFLNDAWASIGASRTADNSRDETTDRHPVLAELVALSREGASVDDLIAAARKHKTVFPTGEAAARFARKTYSLLH